MEPSTAGPSPNATESRPLLMKHNKLTKGNPCVLIASAFVRGSTSVSCPFDELQETRIVEERGDDFIVTQDISHSEAFLKGSHRSVRPAFEGSQTLGDFLRKAARMRLSGTEKILLVDQAFMLLESFYVNLPLKRVMYAIDPLQRLRLLRRRLAKDMSDLEFHAEMTDIFASLHDLHTGYLLPEPFRSASAALPFAVEAFFERGKRKYLVSKVRHGFKHPTFAPGVAVELWNGVPVEHAIERAGTVSRGSNVAARHANGLARLTARMLARMPPPDHEWVTVRYQAADGKKYEARFEWRVLSKSAGLRIQRGSMSVESDLIRQIRKLLFAPHVGERSEQGKPLRQSRLTREEVPSELRQYLSAWRIDAPGQKIGYIRIYSFNAPRVQFVREFTKLLALMPEDGLVIDVRDNPGGHISNAEQLLPLLGAVRPVEPARLCLINTPLNLELCELRKADHDFGPEGLEPWRQSLIRAAQTGAQFSAGYPYTDLRNATPRKYFGPVAVVTNAISYSATEFFAAGIQDHEIGVILGVDETTGGGGANMKQHQDLMPYFDETGTSPFKSLPRLAGFSLAFRRSQRVRGAAGHEIEDFGVASDETYRLTRADLLEDNVDLIIHTAKLLKRQKRT
jgi:C-terminal processing protease CtpA/Prc